jgi:phosphoglycolate phosphatase
VLYLFDIDGTILLAGGAGSKAINRVFSERYALEDAMADIRPGGKTDPGIITEIFQSRIGRAPRPGEVEAVLAAYVPYMRTEVGRAVRFRMMPHVVATIYFLDAQPEVLLGLATGNIRASSQIKLEHLGLWHRFAIGGFGDDCAERAGLVQHAIDRANAHAGITYAPDKIVVVGDTPRDVEAARACGVRAVTVATGPTPSDRLLASHPDAALDTLAELPAWHRQQL